MKVTEQYFPVVLFIMLYKLVLSFGSVDEILKSDFEINVTEQFPPLLLFFFYALQRGSNVEVCGSNSVMSETYIRICFSFPQLNALYIYPYIFVKAVDEHLSTFRATILKRAFFLAPRWFRMARN